MRASTERQKHELRPNINVTPLIDVLLVLLIIFMVITPLRPSRFKTTVPQPPPPTSEPPEPDPRTIIVTIERDLHLKLNHVGEMGTVNEMGKLSMKLAQVFQQRRENHVYRDGMEDRVDLPEEDRIEKTVFIKGPRSIPYGEVVKVIDGIKGAGANPIGLQIDELD